MSFSHANKKLFMRLWKTGQTDVDLWLGIEEVAKKTVILGFT